MTPYTIHHLVQSLIAEFSLTAACRGPFVLKVDADGVEKLFGLARPLIVPSGSIEQIAAEVTQRAFTIQCGHTTQPAVASFNCDVEKLLNGGKSITLSDVTIETPASIMEACALEEHSYLRKVLLQGEISQRLIIAAPTHEVAQVVRATCMKVCSGRSKQPVVITADDLVGAIMQHKDIAAGDSVVSVTTVRVNCPRCSKKAQPDPTLMSKLPHSYQSCDMSHYQIGRGCEQCQHTGFRGYQWIDSGIVVSPLLAELTQGRLVETLIADEVALAGGVTLLEVLFAKVKTGEISLDALFAALGNSVARQSPLFERKTHVGRRNAQDQRKKRILIVEDDRDQSAILSLVLQDVGYEVVEAHDGSEALEILKREQFNLVISDLMMPRVDGVQLLAQMRKEQNMVPVLILTVLGDEERECALLDLGADDYCSKAIHKKTLLKRIEALLRRVA